MLRIEGPASHQLATQPEHRAFAMALGGGIVGTRDDGRSFLSTQNFQQQLHCDEAIAIIFRLRGRRNPSQALIMREERGNR